MRFRIILLPASNTKPHLITWQPFRFFMARVQTICITGHQPNKLGGYKINETATWVKGRLEQAIDRAIKRGAVAFISTGTLGVGQWAAEIIIKRKKNPVKMPAGEIKLIIAQPFELPSSRWPVEARRAYEKNLQKADKIVLVNDGQYAAFKIQKRNEWMVDHSDAVIAVWDGSEGEVSNFIN